MAFVTRSYEKGDYKRYYRANKATTMLRDDDCWVQGVEFKMVRVQGGTFLMGSQNEDPSKPNYDEEAWEKESPVHQVTLTDYAIGETQVTQELWQAVMGNNPSWFGNHPQPPVEQVSWYDICEKYYFLKKLNELLKHRLGGRRFVLPTEAQWEYAAAGGQRGYNPDGSRKHFYSGNENIDAHAWYNGNSDHVTFPPKKKLSNELELYDMRGNVWEWCSDWYGDYSDKPQTNPEGPKSGTYRVIRGGSWCDSPNYCRVSFRNFAAPEKKSFNVGFRLVLRDRLYKAGGF